MHSYAGTTRSPDPVAGRAGERAGSCVSAEREISRARRASGRTSRRHSPTGVVEALEPETWYEPPVAGAGVADEDRVRRRRCRPSRCGPRRQAPHSVVPSGRRTSHRGCRLGFAPSTCTRMRILSPAAASKRKQSGVAAGDAAGHRRRRERDRRAVARRVEPLPGWIAKLPAPATGARRGRGSCGGRWCRAGTWCRRWATRRSA